MTRPGVLPRRFAQELSLRAAGFDPGAFLDWYEGRLGRYQGAEKCRKEIQRVEARRRQAEEIAECSFSPRSSSKPAARRLSSCAKRLGNTPGRVIKEDRTPGSASAAAHQLVAEQALQVGKLRTLDEQEQEQHKLAEQAAARELEAAVEEGKCKLKCFMETSEGHEYLVERAHSYMKLNHGIDLGTAMREAQEDLVQASEARLRSQAAASLQQRVQGDLQHIQLERLKVARELIQLQRRCQNLLAMRDL